MFESRSIVSTISCFLHHTLVQQVLLIILPGFVSGRQGLVVEISDVTIHSKNSRGWKLKVPKKVVSPLMGGWYKYSVSEVTEFRMLKF